jgi:hypothetical protein
VPAARAGGSRGPRPRPSGRGPASRRVAWNIPGRCLWYSDPFRGFFTFGYDTLLLYSLPRNFRIACTTFHRLFRPRSSEYKQVADAGPGVAPLPGAADVSGYRLEYSRWEGPRPAPRPGTLFLCRGKAGISSACEATVRAPVRRPLLTKEW